MPIIVNNALPSVAAVLSSAEQLALRLERARVPVEGDLWRDTQGELWIYYDGKWMLGRVMMSHEWRIQSEEHDRIGGLVVAHVAHHGLIKKLPFPT